MKSAFIILLLLLALPSQALDISRRDQRLILSDPSCEEVTEVSKSLANWSQNVEVKRVCPIQSRMPEFNGRTCEFDITDCVPDHVVKYQGVQSKYAGPNCWNLALVLKGILPALRYAPPEEMAYYMKPPLCRQLSDNEERAPGDVGAIRRIQNGGVDEWHGFIYISEKIAYSKNGYEIESPYALQPLEGVYQTYGVPRENQCRANAIDINSSCPKAVAYFRCISMREYLNERPEVPKKMHESFQQVGAVENCLQACAVSGKELSSVARTNLVDSYRALAFYLDDEFKKNDTNGMNDEEKDFLLGALQLRLSAIYLHLWATDKKGFSKEISSIQSEGGVPRGLALMINGMLANAKRYDEIKQQESEKDNGNR